MFHDRPHDERTAAIEDWEASLCAYEVEAARLFAEGLRAAGQVAPDADTLARLTELRTAEERAMRRFLDLCDAAAAG
jgi:hypothetical protein